MSILCVFKIDKIEMQNPQFRYFFSIKQFSPNLHFMLILSLWRNRVMFTM